MRYIVKLPLQHNGTVYEPGTTAEFDPAVAACLGNTVEPLPEAPAAEPAPAAAPDPAPAEPDPVTDPDA